MVRKGQFNYQSYEMTTDNTRMMTGLMTRTPGEKTVIITSRLAIAYRSLRKDYNGLGSLEISIKAEIIFSPAIVISQYILRPRGKAVPVHYSVFCAQLKSVIQL